MGYDIEAGITYSGRTVRGDGRWAYQTPALALSAGLGVSGNLARRASVGSPDINGLDIERVSGWGLDLPLVVGWKSDADLVWIWTGARAGYNRFQGDVVYSRSADRPNVSYATIHHAYGLGVLGFAIGFRYLHAAVELQAGYQRAEGSLWQHKTTLDGLLLSPSTALIAKF